jgi:hypothetical protein
MASSEQFKQAIKTGKLQEALLIAMGQGFELDITTGVNFTEDQPHPPSGKHLRTRINLVRGEIDNEIGEDFLHNGVVKELEKLHSAQIATAPQILQSNLESLQKIFRLATSLQQQKLGVVNREVVIEQTPPETLRATPIVNRQIIGETNVFPTFTETVGNVTPKPETPVIPREAESADGNLELLEPELEASETEEETLDSETLFDSEVDLNYEESVLSLETLEPEAEGFEAMDMGEVTGDLGDLESLEEISKEFSSFPEDFDSPMTEGEDLGTQSRDSGSLSNDNSDDDWGDLLGDVSSEANSNENGGEWEGLPSNNESDFQPKDLGGNSLNDLDWDDDADWEEFDETLESDVKAGAEKN